MKEKAQENISIHLMSDPLRDIRISGYESEKELREKADIHRARLKKFGKSKMNGEILYLGPKGGVFTYSEAGYKKYI